MSDLIFDTKRRIVKKYPRFASEIAKANIIYDENLDFHTAATDGKDVFVDPTYFESLSEPDRDFLLAHEILHNKFLHMYRLKDKTGKKRDMEIWNEACDAVINANLERDGFTIKEGYVNRPEALGYTAEEFYKILLKEKQKNNQNQDNGEQSKGSNGDDHSKWEKAYEEHEQEKAENRSPDSDEPEIDENAEFTENRKEKVAKFKQNKSKTQKKIKNLRESSKNINFGDVGTTQEEIDWRRMLVRNLKKPEIVWSRRRGIKENNYAYRLEEVEVEDESISEVMIDVSASVNLQLIKAFLRQLKPLLKESKLRVGCFNTKFFDFVEINSVQDIDNFTLPENYISWAGGTDLDLPVRSFSKGKKTVNKIIFTDGFGDMPANDLRKENVIWLIYGNDNFNPCCGKVIQITEKQIQSMQEIYNAQTQEEQRS